MSSSRPQRERQRRFVRRRLPRDGRPGAIAEANRIIESLKVTEEALRRRQAEISQAERELRLTLDTIPALVWQTRADGFAEYFNKRWLDYTGLSLEQALGWSWQVAIHPDDHPGLLESWQGVLETEKPAPDAARRRRFEARLRRFDGAYRWFLFRPAPYRNESGKLVRWYGTNTDIEYQKRAESALHRSEAFLAEAQKLSRTGSFGWHVSKGEIFWSKETFHIFEYEPGRNVTIDMVIDRVHPDDRALVQGVIDRAASHKEAFEVEHRLQMSDGSIKHLHVVAHALVDEPQNLQFAGAVMDVTAAKQTEQALRQSETRYQNLFQAMAVSFFEVDYTSSGQILRALREAGVIDFRRYFNENPAFIREIMRATRVVDVNEYTVTLFGRGSKEELLTSVEPFWPEESHQDYVEAVLASIERNDEFSSETRMRKLDGTLFDAQFTLRYASEDKTRGLAGVIDITARKQAEQTLRSSEARLAETERELRLTLDSIPAITWRGARNGFVQHLNKRWFEYTGTTPEQVRGRRWKSCIHPEDLEHLVDVGNKYVASGDPIDAEARLRRFDGEYRWFLFRPAPARDEAGNIVGWYGTITDIEERKQAEAALRQSEQRYRHLFQDMPVALWHLNARGVVALFKQLRAEGVKDLGAHFDAHPSLLQRLMEMFIIEEVNQHAVKMLGGRNTSEIVGTSIARYFPESSPTFRRSMVSRYRGEPNYGAETKLRTLDGRVIDVLYTASRVGPIGEPGMSLLGMIDITERKRAEEALRRSEQRYRHLFRNTPVALWQLNSQPLVAMFRELRARGVEDLGSYIDDHPEFLSRVLSSLIVEEVNDYAIQLFGARDANELTRYPTHWIWREGLGTLQRALASRWRGEESFQEATKLVRRDGRIIDVLFTAARPQMIEDLPISLVSMIDLTERVRAQEELRRMQADFAHAARISMLGELTASIAHEVNQPLAAIAAGGEASLRWLGRPTPDVNEVLDLTKRMVADARRASDIVARIRHMATRRTPEQTLMSLDDVIREALLFLRHEVESREVAISHLPLSDLKRVLADRTQLQQVVVNLTVNALQAIAQAESANRSIVIRTAAHDGATVRCSIEDSGPGIDPQHITRLFDSFFTTKDGGMGMGLRICRSVIEAHGGRIEADNRSSLGGARFVFSLPIANAPA